MKNVKKTTTQYKFVNILTKLPILRTNIGHRIETHIGLHNVLEQVFCSNIATLSGQS